MSTSLLDNVDADTEEDEPEVTLKRSNNSNETALDDGNNPDEVLLKKKKHVMQKPFTTEILCGRDGLVRIYENFPREDMFRGR